MNDLDLKIGEMNCEKCARRLEGVLNGAPGVKRASVLFDAGQARVSFRPLTIDKDGIIALVEGAGFTAEKV